MGHGGDSGRSGNRRFPQDAGQGFKLMNTVQLLLVTSPIERSQARALLVRLRKRCTGVRVRLVGSFPRRHPDVLTGRQREVLRGIAVGATVKEIAARLGISVKTVETHRAALMKRLAICRVSGLVRYAIQSGTVPADWLVKADSERILPSTLACHS